MRSNKPAGCAGVIVAAGGGTRMGGVVKPLIKIGGVPLYASVLEAFRAAPLREIVVVCSAQSEAGLRALTPSEGTPVRFVRGGETRAESVFQGVDAAGKNAAYICVHDCARPFVTSALIGAVLEAAARMGAASAACPVVDTIKYRDAEAGTVLTPDRDRLLAVQTPQVFRRDSYLAAYALALRGGKQFTDETGLLEAAGFAVEYVDAPRMNIKLTTAEDVQLARAYAALLRTQAQKDAEQEAFPPSV